ncbi:MAG: selenide, water dikinase SelD [Gammaproteobacteria bacterium]|nr:selenide, water dikinase SelD [Gammaproteobacteria bacterium]
MRQAAAAPAPVFKNLVLVGGGHAHVGVLRRFAMRPMTGVRVTLITRDIHTPYSGMLPGLIAGHYDFDACHIDLGPLARFAAARLYHAEVTAVDVEARAVHVDGRPPIPFDVLSINIGSRPATLAVPGAAEHALAVKPIDDWLRRWQEVQARFLAADGRFRLLVVGGGAGGVEMALATQYRLQQLAREHAKPSDALSVTLISADAQILSGHNAGVRRRFERMLHTRGVTLLSAAAVTSVGEAGVELADGRVLAGDAVLWVTHAAAQHWPAAAGLAVDDQGFIRVDDCLQSLSHRDIFAAGDIASLPDARPKSGVFAVRQGPILDANLRRALTGKALRPYHPQRRFLGLISTGDRYAVASRGNWSLEGAWLWTFKDWIDRRFMRRFNELPPLSTPATLDLPDGLADEQAAQVLASAAIRCGGCGAKVGSDALTRVMQRLPLAAPSDLVLGPEAADDAAVLQIPPGKVLVQSVDHFRAFIDDPYLFGRIAANHALGDLFAMGAAAHSALAVATVPYGIERDMEQTLYELMSGAVAVLSEAGAVLAGGHSGEGGELAFGLVVNGLADADALLRKGGLRPGDCLLLCKPIGTGTLLAADMRRRAKGRWIDAALTTMQASNRVAMQCLHQHAVSACTDVTGFGLVGHLLEMLTRSGTGAVVDIASVPLLDGALDTVAAGILSTMQPQNLRLRRAVQASAAALAHPAHALMFDPQTAGGLLAGVPGERADACLQALRASGYPQAAIIGRVTKVSDADAPLTLQ